jgi:hypothetical protein
MDPISAVKKEPSKEVILAQPEVAQNQLITPEVSPVVEVVGKKEKEQPKEQEMQMGQSVRVERNLPPPPAPVAVHKPAKDRFTQEIEEILEEDLKDLYLALPKENQAMFRQKGEETLSAVRELVRAAHVNVKKIFQLIRAWLKTIPGVNRFFLEQEAKIKTDKILLVSKKTRVQSIM